MTQIQQRANKIAQDYWLPIINSTTGVAPMTYPDTYELAKEELQSAFGSGINLNADLITANGTINNQVLQFVTFLLQNPQTAINYLINNVYNLNNADGYALDLMGSYYDVYRVPATPTIFATTITGTPNTIIPTYTQVDDVTNPNNPIRYQTFNQYTIGNDGAVIVYFQSIVLGNILITKDSALQIKTSITGVSGISKPIESSIVIGNYETTSPELYNEIISSIQIKSNNGINALSSQLRNNDVLRNQINGVTIADNNSVSNNYVKCTLPNNNSIVVAINIVWTGNQDVINAIGQILYRNYVNANYDFPLGLPNELKHEFVYNPPLVTEPDNKPSWQPEPFNCKIITTVDYIINFTVKYYDDGNISQYYDDQGNPITLQQKVTLQFTAMMTGAIKKYPQCLSGVMFNQQIFYTALNMIGIYNAQITWFHNGALISDTNIQTNIWELPVVGNVTLNPYNTPNF